MLCRRMNEQVMTSDQYLIGGLYVRFPFKPYPSQLCMMDKIIRGLERKQNCLLESPTGSGKSLALLCSSLAWQESEFKKLEREEEFQNNLCCCHSSDPDPGSVCKAKSPHSSSAPKAAGQPESMAVLVGRSIQGEDTDDLDDFKQPEKQFQLPGVAKGNMRSARPHASIQYEIPTGKMGMSPTKTNESSRSGQTKQENGCTCGENKSSSKQNVPKIFFGTRTHKQIAQVIRELRKTAYKDARMVILGSREHLCIDPKVLQLKSTTDGCKEKLETSGCRFQENVRAKKCMTHSQLYDHGLASVWDIEDLIKICTKKKACPYFVTRSMLSQANIIFCPYNYLVDPLIRKLTSISIKDNIVIVDEAHNIEDSCRESINKSITQHAFQKAIGEFDLLIFKNKKLVEHSKLRQICADINNFMSETHSSLEQKNYDMASKVWQGFDAVALLTSLKIGPKEFPDIMSCYKRICEDSEFQGVKCERMEPHLSSSSHQMLEHFFLVLEYMYVKNLQHIEDFRLALLKTVSYKNVNANSSQLWSKKKRGVSSLPVQVYSLNFWCMNPAVAFSDFLATRCVILTSGTLSPMDSFQSELGMNFPIKLEANHVIPKSQVWIGALGSGLNGKSLKATYLEVETYIFQDELGHLIHKICTTIPHGILCFVSSYSMLDKLSARWRTTGLWDKILQRKAIIIEKRATNKVDFEEMWNSFQNCVNGVVSSDEEGADGDCSERDGALFLAVCRGKVSEGMDFADNSARAVITVGIPYPYIKDIQIQLKKQYNDKFSSSRNLLTGGHWFEIQAFRALNQALGRCIRHRNDWGALIMIDARFVDKGDKYLKGLSKWIRNDVEKFSNSVEALHKLSNFTQAKLDMVNSRFEATLLSSSTCVKDSPSELFNATTLHTPPKNTNCYLDVPGQISLPQTPPTDMHPVQSCIPTMNSTILPQAGESTEKQTFGSESEKPVHLMDTAAIGNVQPPVGGNINQTTFLSIAEDNVIQQTPDFCVFHEADSDLPQVVTSTPQNKTVALPKKPGKYVLGTNYPSADMCLQASSSAQPVNADQESVLKLNLLKNFGECRKIVNYAERGSAERSIFCKNQLNISCQDSTVPTTVDVVGGKNMKGVDKHTGLSRFFRFDRGAQDCALAGDPGCKENPAAVKLDLIFNEVYDKDSPSLFEDDLNDPAEETRNSFVFAEGDRSNCGKEREKNAAFHSSCQQASKMTAEDQPKTEAAELMSYDRGRQSKCRQATKKTHGEPADDDKTKITKDSDKASEKSEEIFVKLNVKRNAHGKKRFIKGLTTNPKKKAKGVFFEEFDEEQETFCCARCGRSLITSVKAAKEWKKLPTFIKGHVAEKSSYALFFDQVERADGLMAIAAEQAGIKMNAFWDDDTGCCIQFFQCMTCKMDIVGSEILQSANPCDGHNKLRQIWLFSSKVKLQKS